MASGSAFDSVIFDLGNTLVPFTPKDSMEFVVKWYHSAGVSDDEISFNDFLTAFRSVVLAERERSERELWESNVERRSEMMVTDIKRSGRPKGDLQDRLASSHTGAFTSCLRSRPSSLYVLRMVSNLIGPSGIEVKVGLISNAVDGEALRSFMDRADMTPLFDDIQISGEVGFAKPHKEMFLLSLERLGTEPDHSVYIGDRYKTDVLGSRNSGMKAIYTREYETAGEPPEGLNIDVPTIQNILDLPVLLEIDTPWNNNR